MSLGAILTIIIVNYLRRTLKKAGFDPRVNKQLLVWLWVSIGMLVLQASILKGKHTTGVLSDALLLGLLYYIFTTPVFRNIKWLFNAVLPLAVVSLVEDIIRLVAPGFAKEWNNYIEAAQLCAFVWLLAMWFITRRQRKALEAERLKALEREKEFRITESLKAALEIQVAERTLALTQQKDELQHTITELKSTQAQLIQSEKMASLGELTAGIAHEIQNPLNFVNNFSEVNTELIAEMREALNKGDIEEAKIIAADISANEEKINHHGKRADAIVKGMLQHSRSNSGQKEPTDINALADEYLRLAYHGLRAKDKSFNATMKTDFDETIGKISVIPQDLGRVILNLITNAFYVVAEKKKPLTPEGKLNPLFKEYVPTVTVSTKKTGNKILISVRDNGNGIPPQVLDKVFQPFFTTKPTGQGTGLGLSMSYDIVTKGHGGELKVETKEKEGTVFTIQLPIQP